MSGPDLPPRLSFGAIADRYDRGRPSYPAEAVAWLTGGPARVLELGAGTGKLTEVLVEGGCEVVATDPDERMLHHLRRRLPGVAACCGVAEEIPLPSRSVDLVVAAQAFHWFDLPRAVPEIARVLRPGGVLALVWNERDEQVPWVRKLGRALGGAHHNSDVTAELEPYDEVAGTEERTFRHWQSLDREALLDMVASRSHIAQLDDDEQDRRLAAVSAIYDDYARGPEPMLLPYVTRCFRVGLRDLAPAPEPLPTPVATPLEVGEPTVAMDRADLPLGRRRHGGDTGPDGGSALIDLR